LKTKVLFYLKKLPKQNILYDFLICHIKVSCFFVSLHPIASRVEIFVCFNIFVCYVIYSSLIKIINMKTLTIMRHAKSSWDFSGLSDIKRPLISVGESRTQKVVKYLEKRNFLPATIVCSNAVRTLQTSDLVCKGLNCSDNLLYVEKNLYSADIETLFELIFSLDNRLDSAMFIGHNPVMTTFANRFLSKSIDWLPTSGVVSIDFETEKWEDTPLANHWVRFYIAPSMLDEDGNVLKQEEII